MSQSPSQSPTFTQSNVPSPNSSSSRISSADFWKKSLSHIPSSFGASSKNLIPSKKDLDSSGLYEKSCSWVGKDFDGATHGRLQISSSLGRSLDIPGPGHYDPNDLKLSKREIAPKITIGLRLSKNIENQSLSKQKLKSTFPPLRQASPPRKESDLKRISVEVLRQSLLPGPGIHV